MKMIELWTMPCYMYRALKTGQTCLIHLPAIIPWQFLMSGPEAVIGRPSGFRLPDCNRWGGRLKFLVIFVLSKCRFTFVTPATVRCFNSKLGSTTFIYQILKPIQSNMVSRNRLRIKFKKMGKMPETKPFLKIFKQLAWIGCCLCITGLSQYLDPLGVKLGV